MAEAKLSEPNERQATVDGLIGLSSEEARRLPSSVPILSVKKRHLAGAPIWESSGRRSHGCLKPQYWSRLGRERHLGAAVIAGLLLFNATLGFIHRAALAALKKRLAPTALARADGQFEQLSGARARTVQKSGLTGRQV
jgi:hypothetical protein